MRKLLALAALVLGLASCQTEPEGLDVNVGGEVDTVVTVSLPETTRANSAEGAFVNVDLDDYTIRYILQVYYKGEPSKERLVKYSDDKSVAFNVRLVPGRDYNFVVWADLVEGNNFQENVWSNDDGLHYDTTNLHEIELKDTWVAMDETRDAFTGYYNTADHGVKYSGSLPINITLTRPFAKLRVITTDMKELSYLNITPVSAKVTYSAFSHESFNALDGTYSGEISSKTHTYAIAEYADFANNVEKKDSHKVLFTDYFFADASDVVKFELDVYEGDVNNQNATTLIKHNDFKTDIPAQRNYLTTIQGNILTDGNNITVTVENDGKFEGEIEEKIVEVGNATDLQEAINEADEDTTIVLGGDIDLGDLFGASILSTRAAATLPIVIPEGKVVALDLNGFNLTTPFVEGSDTNHEYAFENHGSLTIQDSKGNGEIIARGIFNYGTMTLKSGIINACDGNGGYGVRNYIGATFVMNGGSIVTSNEDDNKVNNGGYDATTLRIDKGATATINGGTINNICDYTFAIDNYGTTTINGGTITSIHSTVSTYGDLTIDGGTFTCNGIEGVTAHTIVAWDGSETTINGGTFDGKDNYNGFNVDADEGAIVNINGGKFRPVHSGSLYGKGTIIVKGGEFFDDPSARVADGYKAVEQNGVYIIAIDPVAKIGETEYATLEAAVAAAKEGNTITILRDVTLSAELKIPAGIILDGNGKQINGSIYAGGNLTFVGHTKVTSFSASYNNGVITIGEGACLEVTGTGRVTLGYGNTFNITGSIEDAKTADKANIQPSLIIPGGISITGGNNATMNVNNAYVTIGNTSSKNSAANGKFTLNFTNSIAEFTNQFTLSEPTGSNNPTFEVNITNSVFTTSAKLCIAAPNSKFVVNNSIVTPNTYFRNSGKFDLVNGSVMTGSTIQFGENGGNNGAITVDNSSFTINCGNSTGHAFDGKGVGSITANNGANVAVQYYQDMTINVDETSTFVGTDIYGNRKIYYVSDEMALAPTNPDALGGAVVKSNVWDKSTGKGVITFDRNLTTIGEKAFQRVTNATPSNWVTSITLPESVETIGDYAFAQCYSLTTINIPDSVTSIGQYAFQSCDAVTSVTIGSGVTSIGSGAFYNCYEIKEIICESTTAPALADKWVFNGVDEAATVYVPAAALDTYKAAQYWNYFTNIVGK